MIQTGLISRYAGHDPQLRRCIRTQQGSIPSGPYRCGLHPLGSALPIPHRGCGRISPNSGGPVALACCQPYLVRIGKHQLSDGYEVWQ